MLYLCSPMNKRISFILLPVLALIISINCRAHYGAFFNNTVSGISISSVHQYSPSHSISANKQTNNRDKNAIRIKAKDGGAAIVLSCGWAPVANVFFYSRPSYFYYSSPVLPLRFSRYKLRGPPTV